MDMLIIVAPLIVIMIIPFIMLFLNSNPGFLGEFFKILCSYLLPFAGFGIYLYLFIEKIDPSSPSLINESNRLDLILAISFLIIGLIPSNKRGNDEY